MDSLEDKALKIIRSRKRGVLQKDLHKRLKVSISKCYFIIKELEEKKLITRKRVVVDGNRTYRILAVPKIEYSLLLADGMIAPCIGCTVECTPENCESLATWVQNLLKEEKR
jgi:DNA-binding Lrp family transcriptional regulator